jgi:hypothetical protein
MSDRLENILSRGSKIAAALSLFFIPEWKWPLSLKEISLTKVTSKEHHSE